MGQIALKTKGERQIIELLRRPVLSKDYWPVNRIKHLVYSVDIN